MNFMALSRITLAALVILTFAACKRAGDAGTQNTTSQQDSYCCAGLWIRLKQNVSIAQPTPQTRETFQGPLTKNCFLSGTRQTVPANSDFSIADEKFIIPMNNVNKAIYGQGVFRLFHASGPNTGKVAPFLLSCKFNDAFTTYRIRELSHDEWKSVIVRRPVVAREQSDWH